MKSSRNVQFAGMLYEAARKGQAVLYVTNTTATRNAAFEDFINYLNVMLTREDIRTCTAINHFDKLITFIPSGGGIRFVTVAEQSKLGPKSQLCEVFTDEAQKI